MQILDLRKDADRLQGLVGCYLMTKLYLLIPIKRNGHSSCTGHVLRLIVVFDFQFHISGAIEGEAHHISIDRAFLDEYVRCFRLLNENDEVMEFYDVRSHVR